MTFPSATRPARVGRSGDPRDPTIRPGAIAGDLGRLIASAVGESTGTVGVSSALKLMELAGGTLKVTEVLAQGVQKCKSPGRSSAISGGQERVRAGEERCAEVAISAVFDSRTNDPLFS
jgi:hypothetical protein